MTARQKEIIDAAMSLPPSDRVTIAEHLLATLEDDDQAAVDAAWKIELDRRLDALDRGDVDLIPGDEILGKLERGECP